MVQQHHNNNTSEWKQQQQQQYDDQENFFFCRTCPYTCPVSSQQQQHIQQGFHPSHNIINTKITNKKCVTVVTDLSHWDQFGKRRMMNKNSNHQYQDLDILGGASAWENVDRTTVYCAKCGTLVPAYFRQIQIRSADEPMTIFYKCSVCAFQWNE